MIFIGLDPGAISGAWGAIDHNRDFIGCGDIPSVDGRISSTELHRLIKGCVSTFDTACIVVENVHTMPKQGIASSGKFMRAAGAIEATAELTRYPFMLVTPQRWKAHFSLIGASKDDGLVMARKMFPNASLVRKKDHGRADALLMATWLKDTYE